ncbi:MAG TPA: Wzz/FepE/Etk N-terminal domain-containing protein [Verrucomicrobiae bacterium]|nr:Wzz/FepE/Etk N-terminal domain-containing protein [Verrucomicrobiae bacterium]
MQTKNSTPPPASSMNIGDIYYVLFKHKWLIFLFSALGLMSAAVIFVVSKPPYVSEAQLMIQYQEDSKPVGNQSAKPIQLPLEGIMTAEASILKSLDVLGAAVDVVGAEKILGKDAKTTNKSLALVALHKQVLVDFPARGNVLRVAVKHPELDVVQPLLRQVLDAYYRKHVEIYRNLGVMDDSLTQLTDQAKARLSETEESLRKLKAAAGVTSLDDSRRQASDRYNRVIEELRTAEVELEERRAALKELQKSSLVESAAATDGTTNAAVATAPAVVKVAPEIVDEYQRLLARLELYKTREQALLANFRPESTLVREARANVETVEKEKLAMLAAHPRLADEEPVVTRVPGTRGPSNADVRTAQISAENARIVSLEAKIKTLNSQLLKAREEVAALDRVERDLIPLQRKKALEETNYLYYSTTLNQARFDNSLVGGQLSNIKEIQAPSMPYRDKASMLKLIAGVAFAGIALGFGLAFLLETVFNQTVRKSSELEKDKLPTFMTIPQFGLSKRGKKPLPSAPAAAAIEYPTSADSAESANGHALAVAAEVAPWDEQHQLHPYAEALRDRLMSFFEIKGLTHKPKLVAITSCSHGAGVTTLAAGLAASLSQTGEGNVLLIDMNTNQEAAHPFYRGKPAIGLFDALENEKRPAALVQDNLYMVQGTTADDRLPHVLPKRIRHLIPKLQASDYDYIIFDMPPITQTSVTPRLAGFMDMVFMVVEDGKTNRDWLKQASSLLHESKANLGAVFNKRRAYVPKWLHQEF